MFPTPVWAFSKTPSKNINNNSTKISLSLSSATSGFVLFHPGETETNQQTASIPPPTSSSAHGWITPFTLNKIIPAGNWSLGVGINHTGGILGTGIIALNASLYIWNSSLSTFTYVAAFQNSSVNLVNMSISNQVVNLSGKVPRLSLDTSQDIFVEYYLSLNGFLSTATYTFILDSGGPSDSSYFVSYPDFGWLNGSVHPANSTVSVNNSIVGSVQGGLFNITLGPGTYWINVSLAGYRNYSGQIAVVSGYSAYLNVTLQKEYAVDVAENGLAAGTQWSVNLSGIGRVLSTNSTQYSAVNGTYNLSVGSVSGYHVASYPRNVTVNGSQVSILLTFTVATYGITFSENGLPLPMLWGISINGVNHTSETSSIYVNLPNGTYSFAVLHVPHYAVTPSSGSLKVSGSTYPMTLNFSLLNYTVFFRENGLPIGTEWSVTLHGLSQKSNRTVITFNEPEGTYNYSITIQNGYRIINGTGAVTVAGGNVTINATFLTLKRTTGNVLSQSQGLFYFLIIVIVLVQIEVIASMLYFRRNRSKGARGSADSPAKPDGSEPGTSSRPVSQILAGSAAAASSPAASDAPHPDVMTADRASSAASAARDFAPESMFEYGCTYAVFEETAEKSLSLFEVALKKGLKGICFTREFPDRLSKKHDLSGALVIWLSNIGSQNSIRPKDLEKITLQCNEALNSSQCIIMIDGLEYLITNNGFISVLKLLQFLRDATAVNRSILIISINQHAIKDSEVNLLRREVDRIIE